MGSRATPRKIDVLLRSPGRYTKSAGTVISESKTDYWKFNFKCRRIEHISQKNTSKKNLWSYWLIDFKRLIIICNKSSYTYQSTRTKSNKINDNPTFSLKHTLNALLLGICASYIGSVLFQLTDMILKLILLLVISI